MVVASVWIPGKSLSCPGGPILNISREVRANMTVCIPSISLGGVSAGSAASQKSYFPINSVYAVERRRWTWWTAAV